MEPVRQKYSEDEAVAQVGRGWEELVRAVYAAKYTLNSPANIITVKEKLGGLRIYIDYYDEELDKVVQNVGVLSFAICEVCGNAGKLRKLDALYLTRCETHANGSVIIEGWPNAGF